MADTYEDARYDLDTLRQIHQEMLSASQTIMAMQSVTTELEAYTANLPPLYGNADYFANIRKAVSNLRMALIEQYPLFEHMKDFTFLGNVAITRGVTHPDQGPATGEQE